MTELPSHVSAPSAATPSDWRRALADAVRDPDELCDRLKLPDAFREPARRAAELFPLLVPESYLRRMKPGDPRDPLLRQVLPVAEEEDRVPGFAIDALDEPSFRRAPGLLQKYAGRALLIAAGACAVHCRYCFRRHYPYGEEPRRREDWQPAIDAVAGDPSLSEVILSGGDPLTLSDRRLSELCESLDAVPHVRRLRFHTRLPIVLPERVTPELIRRLAGLRSAVFFVVHANHPREVAGDCAAALRTLATSGFTVLNQSVLLRGVNDDADVLRELSERLVNLGVTPYYLHQLDRVSGTAHFEAPESTGRSLIAQLQSQLPGYAVPKYVREVPGAANKLPVL